MGWGAHANDLSTSGLWSPAQRSLHINILEMKAAVLALKAFSSSLSGKHVLLFTDNTTVACYVRRGGGTQSASLSREAEALLRWCDQNSIILSAKYIPGWLNILADCLSRPHMVLQTEWTLVHPVLERIWEN